MFSSNARSLKSLQEQMEANSGSQFAFKENEKLKKENDVLNKKIEQLTIKIISDQTTDYGFSDKKKEKSLSSTSKTSESNFLTSRKNRFSKNSSIKKESVNDKPLELNQSDEIYMLEQKLNSMRENDTTNLKINLGGLSSKNISNRRNNFES